MYCQLLHLLQTSAWMSPDLSKKHKPQQSDLFYPIVLIPTWHCRFTDLFGICLPLLEGEPLKIGLNFVHGCDSSASSKSTQIFLNKWLDDSSSNMASILNLRWWPSVIKFGPCKSAVMFWWGGCWESLNDVPGWNPPSFQSIAFFTSSPGPKLLSSPSPGSQPQ